MSPYGERQLQLQAAARSAADGEDVDHANLVLSRTLSSGPVVIESIQHQPLFSVGVAMQHVRGASAENSAHELADADEAGRHGAIAWLGEPIPI